MTRSMTTDMLNALDDSTVRPFYLFRAEFEGTILRLYSGGKHIVHDGYSWLGNGWFRGMSSIRETGNIEATGIEVTLSGVPDTLTSLVLGYARQNLPGIIYLGLMNSSLAVISSPMILFEGGFDVAKINRSVKGLTISLSYESNLMSLKKKKEVRYTNQQQKAWYPSDKGFTFTTTLEEWNGFWGKTSEQVKAEKELAKVKAKK